MKQLGYLKKRMHTPREDCYYECSTCAWNIVTMGFMATFLWAMPLDFFFWSGKGKKISQKSDSSLEVN